MLTNALKEQFVLTRYELVKDFFAKFNKKEILKGIEEDLDDLLELADLEISKKREGFFKLEVDPKHYNEVILEVDSGRYVIAGIRFRNLDKSIPFVDIWPSFKVDTSDIESIKRVVFKHFEVFDPKHITLTSSEGKDIDEHYVVGLVDEMKSSMGEESEVSLEKVSKIDFYEKYVEEYKLFYKDCPDLEVEVNTEELEDFEDSLKDGLLFKAYYKGDFIGVISGFEDNFCGLKGLCIRDKLIFKDYKSKGLGTKMQRAFINEIPNDYKVFWGTIFSGNLPSLKSALSTNRVILYSNVKH